MDYQGWKCMNESVSIKEGRIGRRIAPVDNVKIDTVEGDTSLWVPAERGNTGVLYVSENGIYIASEDGYESYSEVVVRVTEESFYGDKDFDHWDYEVPTDFPDLWDSFTLDDFNVDPLAFDDLFNNKDKWDMDIPDLPDNLDFKMKDLKTKKPKKEKITGIDPVSGNEMAVGLDNYGHLTEEILPTSIGIINLPSKLEYIEGETILFSGISVQAYKKDESVWQNNKYVGGIIPFGELFFPVTIAVLSEGEYAYSDLSPDGVACNGEGVILERHGTQHIIESFSGGVGCLWNSANAVANAVQVTIASSHPEDTVITIIQYYKGEFIRQSTKSTAKSSSFTYNNKTVFFSSSNIGGPWEQSGTRPKGKIEHIAWTMVYGEMMKKEGEMQVPVQWSRPGDGQVLETSYTIKVKSNGESGGSSAEETQAINYNGTRYVANEDMNAEAHYQSGTVWIRGEAKVWSVPDAVAFGLLKPEEEKDGGSDSGSEHEGGHF
jgi:hypothetical protein